MIVVPCSMGTLARIAAGTADSTILRAADVFLKERRRLILVPRETPWSLIHARNVVAVAEAGAMSSCVPAFYSRPQSVRKSPTPSWHGSSIWLDCPIPAHFAGPNPRRNEPAMLLNLSATERRP